VRSSSSADGEERAGFLPAPHVITSDPAPVIAAMFTIGADAPIEPRRVSATSWVFTAVIVIALTDIGQNLLERPAPASPAAVVVTTQASALRPPVAGPAEPPRENTAGPDPTATTYTAPAPFVDKENDDHALHQLRDRLAQELRRAAELIDLQAFEQAEEQLEQLADEVQRFPTKATAEREQHRVLRRRLFEARVNAETARQERALQEADWERRLRLIESRLKNGSFPEADTLATSLIDDPSVPPAITDRARSLRQRAKDGLKEIFSGTVAGTTTNTIRKPR
jgi:hypothetical protein